jgi:transposase-like protein
LDEVALEIAGRIFSLWRAVDADGAVLDAPARFKRNQHAALKRVCKHVKKYGLLLSTDPARLTQRAFVIMDGRRCACDQVVRRL